MIHTMNSKEKGKARTFDCDPSFQVKWQMK
jgi:hypothetical protein